MNGQDYEQLTLFPEDSLANHFLLPGSKEARMMTVISGQKCSELYQRSGQLGFLVKMCLGSSIWHSTRCYLNWKVLATPGKRLLFRLAVSMPHTEGTELLFWPTPKASSPLGGCSGARKTLKKMAEKGLITEEERKMYGSGTGGRINPGLLEWLMGYEQQFTKLIPTPLASDCKAAVTSRCFVPKGCNLVTVGGGTERLLSPQSERISGMHSPWENWPDEPGMDRVVNGVPNRVDRIKCLGNAVVPQQFYPFFAAIAEIERKEVK